MIDVIRIARIEDSDSTSGSRQQMPGAALQAQCAYACAVLSRCWSNGNISVRVALTPGVRIGQPVVPNKSQSELFESGWS
jgi:hypothetical protein